ncbi:DUF4233 domain-containing protein [Rhodococcus sp. IEGM 1379]|uniref:DUF4233 domain-containing protein n=1 Tax=Rhodococcus sp. IEGM 1379 TaxID=3047086 RepID=UPI0024B65569|nr:DUF4233 domain-containing protein [Rhodococcus sp. IEGM 1379]MDI9918538.1 DUF4233 domain-containing protein [Rhodococcus sp. IEGM 1379]
MSTPSDPSSTPNGQFGPPTKDPWKGFRGVMAGTLIVESIVVFLTIPVVQVVGGGLTWFSGTYIIGLGVLMILGGGIQGRSWAIWYNVALQVLLVLGVFIHVSIGVMGLVFGLVWAYLVYLRRDIAQRMEKGLLPGQRD